MPPKMISSGSMDAAVVAELVTTLRRKRKSTIGNLQAHFDEIEKEMGTSGRAVMEERLKKLQATEATFLRVNAELEELTDLSDDELKSWRTMETLLINATGKLRTLIDQQITQVVTKRTKKLEHLEIPSFDGQYAKWEQYRQQFTELVMSDTSLANVEKMQYLNKSLKGEAKAVGFEIVWTELGKRFSNERLSIDAQLSKFINMPRMKKENSEELKQMFNTYRETVNTLGKIENIWGITLIHMLASKFDDGTMEKWSEVVGKDTSPITEREFEQFISTRTRIVMQKESNISSQSEERTTTGRVGANQMSQMGQRNPFSDNAKQKPRYTCYLCQQEHALYNCQKFSKLSHQEKHNFVTNENICTKCLARGHISDRCRSTYNCKICRQHHHTLLHDAKNVHVNHVSSSGNGNSLEEQGSEDEECASVHTYNARTNGSVVLATAQIPITAKNGARMYFKALIDPGSEVSFISMTAANILNLPLHRTIVNVMGIADSKSETSKYKTEFAMGSRYDSSVAVKVKALVLQSITTINPPTNIESTQYPHLDKLELADPQCFEYSKIDVLLGAEMYAQIIQEGLKKGEPHQPIAQKTIVGWILMGSARDSKASYKSFRVRVQEIGFDLRKFWEQEEVLTKQNRWTPEETACEKHYQATVKQKENGTYEVAMPFKSEGQENFGTSEEKARIRFYALEKRFRKDEKYKNEYCKVMNEYIELNQMRGLSQDEIKKVKYYIPHHAVIKESSTTTKTRVVFDASAKSSNSYSLNDNLMNGPTIQNELVTTLAQFRMNKIAYSADIEKMYRCIDISHNDQYYHAILWRENEQSQLETYVMTCVTFGTKPAPFLATRTLKQVANSIRDEDPRTAGIIESKFYVDDLLAGSNSVNQAVCDRDNLINALRNSNFRLRKWASNNKEVLRQLPPDEIELKNDLEFDETNSTIKTLGVNWNIKKDAFTYNVNWHSDSTKKLTKRRLLSEISKIFDPHGWLSPVIVKFKILFQKLWICKVDWDQKLPSDIAIEYTKIQKEIAHIQSISIPRWMKFRPDRKTILVGFCDASEQAYAAIVYLCVEENSHHEISLVSSKTKVAPIKIVTLPRLELNAAVLLSKMIKTLKEELQLSSEILMFSDSEIVLAWLSKHSSTWRTYVGNRVAEIQNMFNINQWHHVSTKENPADIASRGIYPQQIKNNELWWFGPKWLTESKKKWKTNNKYIEPEKLPDKRAQKISMHVKQTQLKPNELLNRYSELTKLCRITAYLMRWRYKIKKNKQYESKYLSASEIKSAELLWVKISQEQVYQDEYIKLVKQKQISPSSKLKSLAVFMASELIRVGGRLHNLEEMYDKKHPIILPSKHKITSLIINHTHLSLMHAGTQSTLNTIRNKYWIINGRDVVSKQLHRCVTCIRYKAGIKNQLMGDLPTARLKFSKPFETTGIDYSGSITIKSSNLRKAPRTKSYIALFICMVTKAIHLEPVSDMTTDAFIAALKRFISRRGLCKTIHCDNGSNFVGAENKLPTFINKAEEQAHEQIKATLSNLGIEWRRIPPLTPHVGGLWEAGIKSTKYHLHRTVGNAVQTFEELSTTLCQIEACLNSRPITEMSADVDDLAALTPGHFLIGTALNAIPEEDVTEISENRLSRWQQTQQIVQHFWKQYRQELFGRLQQRPKWQKQSTNFEVGDLVLVTDNNTPPTVWPMARIIATKPDDKGVVRIVKIKAGKYVADKHVNKLCKLPVNTDVNDYM